jgi:multimeric flavodoxin WrbA
MACARSARKPLLLALTASPRRRGNSARLLRAFLRGVTGYTVQRIHLCDYAVAPCRGCGRCQTTHRCWQKDHAEKLIRYFSQADALVLAAPVFFYGFPGHAKTIIDRCHPLWQDPQWRRRPRRPGYFLATCASSRIREFEVIVRETKAFFNTIACTYSGAVLAPGLEPDADARRLALAEAKAQRLGCSLLPIPRKAECRG